MVADTKPSAKGFNSDPLRVDLLPCVRCGHDITWHTSGIAKSSWTDEEWEIHKAGTWDKGFCQWDDSADDDPDPEDKNKCPCTAFKHPDAPKRREAIEHTRRLGLS